MMQHLKKLSILLVLVTAALTANVNVKCPVDDMDSYFTGRSRARVGPVDVPVPLPATARVLGARQLTNGKKHETNRRESRKPRPEDSRFPFGRLRSRRATATGWPVSKKANPRLARAAITLGIPARSGSIRTSRHPLRRLAT